MVKRYDGNSGRAVYVPEPTAPPGAGPGDASARGTPRSTSRGPSGSRGQAMPSAPRAHAGPTGRGPNGPAAGPRPGPESMGQLPLQLRRLLSRSLGELETEDLLLMLILYLLYRESGDKDWLMTLGAMLFV